LRAAEAHASVMAREYRETVLLVEDCQDSRDTFRFMLQSLGYRVIDAGDAEEATRLSHEHSGRIDVLLTDVMLPAMRGGELADLLEEADSELRVILMSGYPAEIAAAKGRPFLQKPFTIDQVSRVIRETLDSKPPRPAPLPTVSA
jgi:two-component system, cell cycle sensor histidine kinase and response regulator CckA